MSLKEDALFQSAQFLFNNGQVFRVMFCNGTWSETTGTKEEIFPSELTFNRADISFQSSIYDINTNAVTTLFQNNSYNAQGNITFNRVVLLSNGRERGSYSILGISGNVVTIDGTPTDWQVGDTVYTTSGSYSITNINGSQITLDNTPTGTVLVNGFGDLISASEISSKIFTSGSTNQLEYEVIISGN